MESADFRHHLLLVSATADPGSGWGRLTFDYLRALDRRQVSWTLLLPSAERRAPASLRGQIQACLPTLPLSFASVRDFSHLLRLLTWRPPALDRRPAIIHSLVDFPYVLIAQRLAQRWGCPWLFTGHGTYSIVPFRHWLDRRLFLAAYRQARAIVVPSQYTAETMRRAAREWRPISVVENPTDPNFSQGPRRPPSGLTEWLAQKPFLLTVGALKHRKGIDVVLAALARVRQRQPRVRLVIVGSGDQQPWRQRAREVGVEAVVRWLGPVTDEELRWLYAGCQVFVLTPRRTAGHVEGYGLVYLEAGSFGKPVVAAASGGVPQAVQHGENGWLVPENDPKATSAAITALLENPALAQRLGQRGRAKAVRQSGDWYAGEMMTIYRRLAST